MRGFSKNIIVLMNMAYSLRAGPKLVVFSTKGYNWDFLKNNYIISDVPLYRKLA